MCLSFCLLRSDRLFCCQRRGCNGSRPARSLIDTCTWRKCRGGCWLSSEGTYCFYFRSQNRDRPVSTLRLDQNRIQVAFCECQLAIACIQGSRGTLVQKIGFPVSWECST